jgi:biopolymer transport protein ExbD
MTPVARQSGLARRHRPLADINVTPLVDVMLVLLVVFMITAPMLAAGLKVDLPRASAARPLPPAEPIVVSVTRDGGVAVGQDVVGRDALVDAVRARVQGDDTRAIHVRGDREAAYGEVVGVIDLLAAGGFSRIALVSQNRQASTAAVTPRKPAATLAAATTGDETFR